MLGRADRRHAQSNENVLVSMTLSLVYSTIVQGGPIFTASRTQQS